ncbi:MAG: DUF2207 domain-containing protein [Bacteroidales bacterium]|nr:DUF2207 domain-containing protein [Bacteroidales bacterium]
MRKIIFAIAALLACTTVSAGTVRSVDIKVALQKDGSAQIVEVWDINQLEGTEWYLVKENLDGADIRDFHVTDETGRLYFSDGRSWEVNRSLEEKAGRYGMVRKPNGYELCWGLGSYGDHIFTVSYTNTALVRSMSDFDYLHEQFISPGLSAAPQKVHLEVTLPDSVALGESNARIWGFGFEGQAEFRNGAVVMESTAPMSRNNSVILLLRLNKGILYPEIVEPGLFQKRLDVAMEGSDYEQSEDVSLDWLLKLVGLMICVSGVLFVFAARSRNKKILGVPRLKMVDSTRVIPFGGDILQANHVLTSLGVKSNTDASVASAIILRMVQRGQLLVRKVDDKHIEISFNDDADLQSLTAPERDLFDMMKEAAGDDVILQDKEFSRWSKRNAVRVDKWLREVDIEGRATVVGNGFSSWGGTFTEAGKQEARNTLGFKKFLSDYTLIDERRTQEAVVWSDYLVFGALYGIADKVAKELSDIAPKALADSAEQTGMGTVLADPILMRNLVWTCHNLSHSITNQAVARREAEMQKRFEGMGGSTSIGGGGGFHGGGFGGGAR